MHQHTLMPNDDACYDALALGDTRFDGRFFVGVTSTGIYCRAVCPAKVPKRENCNFYPSAATAEAAGFRPCLKCRPELAPGIPAHYEGDSIARRAADLLKSGYLDGSIAGIAHELGVSERHLRRLFEQTYGISLVQYRTTCRLLLAKSLLTDTDLSISRIAFSCGFASLRRFNDVFLERYHLAPSHFRKQSTGDVDAPDDMLTISLGYRPPYRFDVLCEYVAAHATPGVEAVVDGVYMRALKSRESKEGTKRTGWLTVADDLEKNRLQVSVSSSLAESLPALLVQIKSMFDVDCLPHVVEESLASVARVTSEDFYSKGIRHPGSFDGFETAVKILLAADGCQQRRSVQKANSLAGRIALELGEKIETPHKYISVLFPGYELLSKAEVANQLVALGVTEIGASKLVQLARVLNDGEIAFESGMDTPEMRKKLIDLDLFDEAGLLELFARVYHDPDVLNTCDQHVREVFIGLNPSSLEALSEEWRPWRSYVNAVAWAHQNSV